jgi:hypothetical protein
MRKRLPPPMRTSPTWNSVFRLQFSVLRSQLSSVPPTSDAKSDGDGRESETILLLFFLACSAISAVTIFFLLFPADGTSRRL